MVEGYLQVNVFINMTCMSLTQFSYDNQKGHCGKRGGSQLDHSSADKTTVLGQHHVFSV